MDTNKKRVKVKKNPAFDNILASVISVLCGLLFGFLMLMIFNFDKTGFGIRQITTAGFSSMAKFAKVLYKATPILMTGLAVAFAFKTGLFNIGATGQYTVGAFFALYTAIMWQWPWWACLLASMVGGAIWGIFPGLFKAYFNVNEVITAIMFNWIGLFSVNLLFANTPQLLANYYGAGNGERTANLAVAGPKAIIPTLGLDKLIGSPYVNISFFLAVIIAVIIYIILQKTTFGYELKACGFNKDASLYAGISAKRNIILSMVISGALAGIGGGFYYLSGIVQYVLEKSLLGMGFNGIPVALLANSSPLGVIFSSLFISYIQVGGEALQPEYVQEIIDIIIASIIYISAFSVLMRGFIDKLLKRRELKAIDSVSVDESGVNE